MDSKTKCIIRSIVRENGEFDGLKLYKKYKYPKKIQKTLLKINFDEVKDTKRVLDMLVDDAKLIEYNKTHQQVIIFKKLYNKIPRTIYRTYKMEINNYIYSFIDLYMEMDIENFIKVSIKRLKKNKK